MVLNLVQHRSGTSVWDRAPAAPFDVERCLAAMTAGACIVAGLRQRSARGLLLLAAGGALAWWAATGVEMRRHRRERLRAVLPTEWREADHIIGEASEGSFPASDAPSWTSTTGSTGPAAAKRGSPRGH